MFSIAQQNNLDLEQMANYVHSLDVLVVIAYYGQGDVSAKRNNRHT